MFKAREMAFEALRDIPAMRPAPYMASRGLFWLQHVGPAGSLDDELRAWVRASYDRVVATLPKTKRLASRTRPG